MVSYAGNMDITQIPGMEDICFGIDREVAVENTVALEDFADAQVEADTQSISAEEAAELPIVRISQSTDAQTTGQQLAQAIRELVALAEKRQQKRQEAIDRFLTAYSAYLAKQGGAERRTP